MSLQRCGFFSRFTFSRYVSCTEFFTSGVAGQYLYRHRVVKLWHLIHFPQGTETLKFRAERLSLIFGSKWSWRSGGCFIWCFKYNGLKFRVILSYDSTSVMLTPKYSIEDAQEALNVVYVRLMLMRLNKRLRNLFDSPV